MSIYFRNIEKIADAIVRDNRGAQAVNDGCFGGWETFGHCENDYRPVPMLKRSSWRPVTMYRRRWLITKEDWDAAWDLIASAEELAHTNGPPK